MQSADYVPGVSGWKMENGLFEINGGPFGPVRMGDLSPQEPPVTDEQLAAICLTKNDLAEPFIVVGGVTYINQALIEQSAFKAQIVEEASARALADDALAGRIGALEKALYRGDEGEGALRDALKDWKPGGTALLSQALVSSDKFAVTMARNSSGQYVCTGIGLGIDPIRGETKDGQTDMELAIEKGDATEILNLIAGQISGAELAQALRDEIAKAAEPTEAGLGLAACIWPLDFEITDPAEQIRRVIREELRPSGLLHRR